MARFFAGKGVQYALVLLFAVTLNFLLPRMMPGSPLVFLVGEDVGFMSADQRAQLIHAFGLDQPLWRQYVIYLAGLARADLGHSFQQGRPVLEIILGRVGWTVLLVGISLLLATLIGITWGTAAAWRRGRRLDLGSLGAAMLLESMPSFWLAMIFIAVFAAGLRWFPVFGAMTPGAGLRGWPQMVNVAWHLTLPLATVFMLNLGYVVSGATVVETVFSYPGVGRLLFEAVLARDYPVLQGTFFVLTASSITANIVADLLYPLIDPRVRHAR